ncbi:MAG: ABC transporter permease subunit [Labilithrix sp.]|nr:ABC transporter permease subunit [Labilithrix sp.]MCW5809915.1 ABC transporter permease subunit [Labilithrix sp.]
MSSETIEKDTKKKPLAAAEADERDERDEDEEEEESDEEEGSDDDDGDDDESDEAATRPLKTSEAAAGPREKVVIDRPSTASMIWTIARRELAGYFNSVITYIVISASMVGLGLFFYMYKGGFWQVDRVTMQRMFDFLPFALCALVIPLFTMRALADEKRVGTIELLITMPVKDSEVILGKFIAALAILTVQLALVVLYPIAMFKWPWHLGELDWGAFWVGMLGLFCLSATGVAMGLMYSSFTDSQILSFFATMLTLTLLYAIGQVSAVESLQGWPGDAIAFISLQSRFEPFARGLIDSRAIVYFVSICVLCLLVAFHALERRKWA